MWKHVQLLDLVKLTGQGGLGLWGYWGPSNLFPNSQKVKSARTCFRIAIFNNTNDTKEVIFMVEEEVTKVERRMPSPLLSRSQEPLKMWREGDTHDEFAMVQGTHFHWIDLCNFCEFNQLFAHIVM